MAQEDFHSCSVFQLPRPRPLACGDRSACQKRNQISALASASPPTYEVADFHDWPLPEPQPYDAVVASTRLHTFEIQQFALNKIAPELANFWHSRAHDDQSIFVYWRIRRNWENGPVSHWLSRRELRTLIKQAGLKIERSCTTIAYAAREHWDSAVSQFTAIEQCLRPALCGYPSAREGTCGTRSIPRRGRAKGRLSPKHLSQPGFFNQRDGNRSAITSTIMRTKSVQTERRRLGGSPKQGRNLEDARQQRPARRHAVHAARCSRSAASDFRSTSGRTKPATPFSRFADAASIKRCTSTRAAMDPRTAAARPGACSSGKRRG